MDESDTSRELKEYLEQHKIHDLFTKIVEELLKTRPEKPIQTIADYLAEEFGVTAGSKDAADEGPTEVIESYEEDDYGSSDDDDDEEDEDVGEMVAIPKKKPVGRRVSVSAGVIDMASAKAHSAPVFEHDAEELSRIRACLDASPLFKECDEKARNTIAKAFENCSYKADEIIIKQGDTVAEHFFLIDKGTGEALIGDQSVKQYTDGDSFGELALLYNQPRAATVKATSDLKLWRLDQVTFKSIIVSSVTDKRDKYIEFLKRCSLMQALSELEIMTLADSLEKRNFSKGQEVIVQGEVGYDFFMIETGNVQCVRDGKEVLGLKSGDYFGELALLYNQPRQATVVVESDTAGILAIDRKTFQRLMGPLGAILKRNPLHQQYIALSAE